MKINILISLFLVFIISCDECEEENATRHFTPELYPTIKEDTGEGRFYSEKIYQTSDDIICIGIGTTYSDCVNGIIVSDAEELLPEPINFYTDREIIIENDTIAPKTNLLTENKLTNLISFYKKDYSLFHYSPQYIIQLNNKTLKLHDYYTFYFRGFTAVSEVEINDSTILYVE